MKDQNMEKVRCFYLCSLYGLIAVPIQMALINVKMHGSTYAMAKI